jgi:hypothetical protein
MNKLSLEIIIDYVTDNTSVHDKIINLWLLSGNKKEDFPKLPPSYANVEIVLKNGNKFKAFLADINSWGGKQFIVNRCLRKRLYINTEEVIKWVFV